MNAVVRILPMEYLDAFQVRDVLQLRPLIPIERAVGF